MYKESGLGALQDVRAYCIQHSLPSIELATIV